MTAAEIFQSLIHVAGLALVFGAGIPLLFSLGMRCMTGDPFATTTASLLAIPLQALR